MNIELLLEGKWRQSKWQLCHDRCRVNGGELALASPSLFDKAWELQEQACGGCWQPTKLTASCCAWRVSAVTTLAVTRNVLHSSTSSFSSSETFSSGWSKSMSNTPAMAALRSDRSVTHRKDNRLPPPHGQTHTAAITGYYTEHAHCDARQKGRQPVRFAFI